MALHILCEEPLRSKIDPETLLSLLPKICKEACKGTDTSVKVLKIIIVFLNDISISSLIFQMKALYFLSLIMKSVDNEYVVKNFLPSLKFILENEKAPEVTMSVLGVYKAAANSLGPEIIATTIVPAIEPMLVDRSLSLQQFELVLHLVQVIYYLFHANKIFH